MGKLDSKSSKKQKYLHNNDIWQNQFFFFYRNLKWNNRINLKYLATILN